MKSTLIREDLPKAPGLLRSTFDASVCFMVGEDGKNPGHFYGVELNPNSVRYFDSLTLANYVKFEGRFEFKPGDYDLLKISLDERYFVTLKIKEEPNGLYFHGLVIYGAGAGWSVGDIFKFRAENFTPFNGKVILEND